MDCWSKCIINTNSTIWIIIRSRLEFKYVRSAVYGGLTKVFTKDFYQYFNFLLKNLEYIFDQNFEA